MTTNVILGYHDSPYHDRAYHDSHALGVEGAQFLAKRTGDVAAQVFFSIEGNKYIAVGFAGYSNVGHTNCDGYPLYHDDEAYHTGPYHGDRTCAGIGAQFKAQKVSALGAQVRAAIYNTTNLRVMCEFPSRGNGSSWTASSTKSSTTSSFIADNLNTDIVEQVWRSEDGVITGIVLDCDVGAGQTVFLDTMAFLNHNLTTSANVTLIGSDNAGHAPPGVTETLFMEDSKDFVYIAPELPLAGYRYWRILIDDSTNSGFLSIGTIVFGSSLIFSGECFVDRVRKAPVNFTDGIATEGFTSVQNDRGIKNKIRLEFKNIRFGGPNWSNINDEVFETARTTLKCLWVPTPQFPLRFMTFAKMSRIPEQIHNVKGEDLDYIDFIIETDESK